jgi:uncharacterized protein with PQ loop repeat
VVNIQKTLPHFDYRKVLEERKKKRRAKILLFCFLILYVSFMGYLFYLYWLEQNSIDINNVYSINLPQEKNLTLEEARALILTEINKKRINPLTCDEWLNNGSQTWAEYCVRTVSCPHSVGGIYAECISELTIPVDVRPTKTMALALLDHLWDSKPHREILLDENMKYIGIGFACNLNKCSLVIRLSD